jgi:hypothetical protein
LLEGLAVRYPFPYAEPDDHHLIGRYCPDLTFATSRLSQFTASGRAVLVIPVGDSALEAAAGWRDRPEVVEVDSIEDDRLSAVLIRPDGVIAWACTPGEARNAALLQTALTT